MKDNGWCHFQHKDIKYNKLATYKTQATAKRAYQRIKSLRSAQGGLLFIIKEDTTPEQVEQAAKVAERHRKLNEHFECTL